MVEGNDIQLKPKLFHRWVSFSIRQQTLHFVYPCRPTLPICFWFVICLFVFSFSQIIKIQNEPPVFSPQLHRYHLSGAVVNHWNLG